jgi:predicted RNA-binding protein with RPS1 domain
LATFGPFKVLDIDDQGRINLSRKVVLKEQEAAKGKQETQKT